MIFKLKPKDHYLKVYISAPYQQTGEVWINTLKIPIYTNYLLKEISYHLNRLGYKRSGYITTDGKEFTPQVVHYYINYYKRNNLL